MLSVDNKIESTFLITKDIKSCEKVMSKETIKMGRDSY